MSSVFGARVCGVPVSVEAKALEAELALVRPRRLLMVGPLTRYWNLADDINWDVGIYAVHVGHESAAWGHDPVAPFIVLRGPSEAQRRAADYLRQRGHPELTEAQVRRMFNAP